MLLLGLLLYFESCFYFEFLFTVNLAFMLLMKLSLFYLVGLPPPFGRPTNFGGYDSLDLPFARKHGKGIIVVIRKPYILLASKNLPRKAADSKLPN